MHELKAIFHGRVQAVGFRSTARMLARQRGLNGYVRNCPDGTVELVVQGKKEELEKIVAELKSQFHIHRVESDFVKPTKAFSDFSVIL